jgi:hypothetical protein
MLNWKWYILEHSFCILRYYVSICIQGLRKTENIFWGGIRLSPLGISAINWPIVHAPDGRLIWII